LDDIFGKEGPLDDSPTPFLAHFANEVKTQALEVQQWKERASFSFFLYNLQSQ